MSSASIVKKSEKQKTNGAFYTPRFLADYLSDEISNEIDASLDYSLLDPALGEGILIESLLTILEPKNIKISNILGIDIDADAIKGASKNVKTINKKSSIKFLKNNALTPFGLSPEEGWLELKKKFNRGNKFDIILSNPPWGIEISDNKKSLISSNFRLAEGQYDIYDLFIELIISQLNEGGIYGIIIPDSIFNDEHIKLRELLLKNSKILALGRLGEKIFDNVNRATTVIIGKKGVPNLNHQVKCFRLNSENRKILQSGSQSLNEIVKQISHYVSQNRFLQNEYYQLDIDLRESERSIIKKLEVGNLKISDYTNSTRGVELSKKGSVVKCPNCGSWHPEPNKETFECNVCEHRINKSAITKKKIIVNERRNGTYRPIKVGEDISRYKSKVRRSIKAGLKGINYKDPSIYEGEKIIIRKTGVGITASIDYENSYTNQVVYIFKIRKNLRNEIPLEFILGLLNSRVYTYYLLKKNGENEWKSHPYITMRDIKDLPLPDINKVDKKTVNTISGKVRDIIENGYDIRCDKEIESEVLKLFNITKKEFKIIMSAIEACEQLIPFKRLLNIKPNEVLA